jgi:hypothetical protein
MRFLAVTLALVVLGVAEAGAATPRKKVVSRPISNAIRVVARAVRTTAAYPGVTCTVTLDPATGNRIDDPNAIANCAS